jgi:outer membrane protein insertion porin family/translocation and assembly module TamA
VKRRNSAALLRFAALGGLLVAPAMAPAQLKCTSEADKGIRKVAFTGNVHFTAGELADHVISTPTDLTKRVFKYIGTKRCLQPGLLAADIQRLKSFYNDQGFPDTRVDTTTKTEGTWVDILFRVQEGEPVLIDSVAITGIDTLLLGNGLSRALTSKKGARFSAALLQADVDTLEARMRNSGFPLGNVKPVSSVTASHHVAVRLNLTPGPKSRIGKITVTSSGPEGTPPKIAPSVTRDILRFREGDLYRERALYDSERQFYRVGNFLSAAVVPDTSHVTKDSLVDVTVTDLEDLTKQFEVNPGYGTLDCLRARVAYTDKAFLQGLNRIELSAQASKLGWANRWPVIHDICAFQPFHLGDDQVSSGKVNYNTSAKLTRPTTLRGGLLPSLSIYSEQRGAFNAYLRTTKIGGAAILSKAYPNILVAQMSYNLEYGHTDAAPAVLCSVFRACDDSTMNRLTKTDRRLAIVGLSASRDMRNNPDSTTAGTVVGLDLRTSSPSIGSDPSLGFNKGVVDASWYHRGLGSGVIAVRMRGGLIGGGAATSGGARLPPPQERLYGGGETSDRGFQQNELGPLIYIVDDTTRLGDSTRVGLETALKNMQTPARVIPAGGNTMYVANFEYRVRGPILPTLQTILFVDAGRVWSRDLASEAGQGLKWTPGIAFRYFSPIGPIQVNFGYNPYPPPAGPVFLGAVSSATAQLVCLSGVDANNVCQPANARRQPYTLVRRLVLSVAFPPDF